MEIIVADGTAMGAADWAAAAEGVADRASVDGAVADGDAIGGLEQVADEIAGRGEALGDQRELGGRRTVVRWKRLLDLWGRVGGEGQYLRKIGRARAEMVFLPRRLHEFQGSGRFARSVRGNCNHCAVERKEVFTAPISEERIKERVSKKKLYFTLQSLCMC